MVVIITDGQTTTKKAKQSRQSNSDGQNWHHLKNYQTDRNL